MRKLIFTVITCLSVLVVQGQQDSIFQAMKLFGLDFTQEEVDSLRGGLEDNLSDFRKIRMQPLPNDLPYSLVFVPPVNLDYISSEQLEVDFQQPGQVEMPAKIEELAFYSVAELSVLLQTRKVTSLELTKMYLSRLKRFGDTLQCVVSLTEELAMEQAKKADEEIAAGRYRGPLHGIPYGVKDLLAVKGYKTTWGAMPFKDQEINYTATVVEKLEAAGAVLVAKLTLGALAWGDVWYGGVTKNPWNLEQGSSGSSAGPASAVAAGLVPFAIGSETWGSIVSPSNRCGIMGLRPTFGRVSKYGAMALSWSMDKLGPMCRDATDLALVFDAIRGSDGKDLEVLKDYPFNYEYDVYKVKNLRVGYLKGLFEASDYNKSNDSTTLALLRNQGLKMIEKELPTEIPTSALGFILSAEAAAAFDELTRSNQDDELTRQIINAWPNVFRSARFIPAVEYIQANRLRYLLVQQFNEMMADIDVLIAPSFGGDQLLMTNLTGHPCVVLPNGSYEAGSSGTITLIGNHFDEASILSFARYLQALTPFEDEHPQMFTP
ncbi:amidase [Marinoscillum sp. 108]|uniref:amidase n=1 Tax=Marinoscillum sp. 108 TaxID=2653151 RepID=UPI0012F466EF|nr:amidase [Marinoscillum sp. 108]VXD13606.1 Asp-tRNA(Asn)/Glu-tRNA(Gln) amidotransferase A subunit family amidase [Marinoscillum sp. 108]